MRFILAFATGALVFSGCTSPPHKFSVDAGGGAVSATLTLNNITTPLNRDGQRFFGERNVSDAAGQIVVKYSAQQEVGCSIGYITNGEFEPHYFVVKNGECREL